MSRRNTEQNRKFRALSNKPSLIHGKREIKDENCEKHPAAHAVDVLAFDAGQVPST